MRRARLGIARRRSSLAGDLRRRAGGAARRARPASTEHGVNRDEARAEGRAGDRGAQRDRGAQDQPVRAAQAQGQARLLDAGSACGAPRASTRARCPTPAPARRAGSARATAGASTAARTSMQPQAPLLDVPNPHPVFGFNDNWIFQSQRGARPARRGRRGQVARTGLAWSGVERTQGSYNWYGSDQLYAKLQRARDPAAVGRSSARPAGRSPTRARAAPATTSFARRRSTTTSWRAFAVAARSATRSRSGSRSGTSPTTRASGAAGPSPTLYAKMLQGGRRRASQRRSRDAGGQRRALAAFRLRQATRSASRNFLERLYELGAAQDADAIGIHPYPGVGPGEDYIADVRVYLGKIQNVMQRTTTPTADVGDRVRRLDRRRARLRPRPPGHARWPSSTTLLRRVQRVDLAIVHRFVEDPELGRARGRLRRRQPEPRRRSRPSATLFAIRGARAPTALLSAAQRSGLERGAPEDVVLGDLDLARGRRRASPGSGSRRRRRSSAPGPGAGP